MTSNLDKVMTGNGDKAPTGSKPPVNCSNVPTTFQSCTSSNNIWQKTALVIDGDSLATPYEESGAEKVEVGREGKQVHQGQQGKQETSGNVTDRKNVPEPRKWKKRIYASKSVSKSQKTSEHGPSSKIIYMHVEAKTIEKYSNRLLNRLPVAYAMKLNDVGQQHRAQALLDQENQKLRSLKNTLSPAKRKERSSTENKDENNGNNNGKKILTLDKKVDVTREQNVVVKNQNVKPNSLFATKRKERPLTENKNENSPKQNHKKLSKEDNKADFVAPQTSNVPYGTKEPDAKPTKQLLSPPSGAASGNAKTTYPLVYEGRPTEKSVIWPPGWLKRSFERPCKTRYDHYWYTPQNRKLRSIVEVKRMLLLLEENGNDEEVAWTKFKRKAAK